MDIGAYASALAEDRRVNHHDDLTTQPGRSRGRRRAAVVRGDRVVLHPAGGGRQRDDAQRDQPRSGGPVPLSRAAGKVVVGLRRPGGHRGRGNRAVGLAGDLHATHPDPRHRAERHQDGGRRQGFAVVQLGQPRRVKVRRSVDFRRGAATPIRMSASAAAVPISVWAQTWLVERSGSRSTRLRREMPDIVATEEPARLLSQFIHGIKSLPVAWTSPA